MAADILSPRRRALFGIWGNPLMNYEFCTLASDDRVLAVTLNRPEMRKALHRGRLEAVRQEPRASSVQRAAVEARTSFRLGGPSRKRERTMVLVMTVPGRAPPR